MIFACPNCGTEWGDAYCDGCGRNLMPRHDTFVCAEDHRRLGGCDYEACGCSCHRTAVTGGSAAAEVSQTEIERPAAQTLDGSRAAGQKEE